MQKSGVMCGTRTGVRMGIMEKGRFGYPNCVTNGATWGAQGPVRSGDVSDAIRGDARAPKFAKVDDVGGLGFQHDMIRIGLL